MADKVLFLVDKDEDHSVFAAFPHIPGTYNPSTMLCYAHIGQHSSCDMDYVTGCRSASPEEYKDLRAELERVGYELDIQKSTGVRDFNRRASELETTAA